MRHGNARQKPWYPVYIDKWMYGSMRHELVLKKDGDFIDLRGIFMDLLTLSKRDDGWIRANEVTAYPITQLAGMFDVPVERLEQCIEICLREDVKKITKYANGIMYINSHNSYDLSDRHKRRFEDENEELAANSDSVTDKEKIVGHYIQKDIDIKKREREIERGKGPDGRTEGSGGGSVNYDMILLEWNNFATKIGLSSIVKLNETRKIALRRRLKEDTFDVKKIYAEIEASEFLRGQNDRSWKVDFDFVFCSANNYLKILEGKYRNRTTPSTKAPAWVPPEKRGETK